MLLTPFLWIFVNLIKKSLTTCFGEILVELVDYIKVYENGNISVKFKFADELRKIAEYIEINTTEDTAVAG